MWNYESSTELSVIQGYGDLDSELYVMSPLAWLRSNIKDSHLRVLGEKKISLFWSIYQFILVRLWVKKGH